MVKLTIAEKKTKQTFFRTLKNDDASFLFQKDFLYHNNKRSFDVYIKGIVNRTTYQLLLSAFTWIDTNNYDLWCAIFDKLQNYDLHHINES